MVLFLFLLTVRFIGCYSTDHVQKGTSTDRSQTLSSAKEEGDRLTVMKPNFIAITASVESVVVIDSVRYRLIVHLKSATSNEGMEAPASDQRLELTPQFIRAADSSIDATHARNKRLLSLRRAQPGDTFSGTIALNPQRQWLLIEVD